MNDAAQNDGFDNAEAGQHFMQSSGAPNGLSGMLHASDKASAQSFVNYMSSSSADAPQTTQTVAMQIQRNANMGINSFTLQLEPAELGRLEVRMKFDRDGGIRAHLIADKPETLNLLKQDAQQIHRILQQAGFDADDNSLSFDLRQQQQNLEQSYNGGGSHNAYAGAEMPAADILQAKIAVESGGYIRQNGVNIMV